MSTLRRLLRYLSAYPRLWFGAVAALVVFTAATLAVPLLLRRLIDQGITPGDGRAILNVTLLLLAAALLGGVSNFLYAFWAQTISRNVAFDLRNDVFGKLQRLSFSYYDQQQTGQLVTRATSDVENARLFVGEGLLQIVSAVLTLVGTVAIIFASSWRLALAALALMPVITLIFTLFIRQIAPRFRVVQRRLGSLNTTLQASRAQKWCACLPPRRGRERPTGRKTTTFTTPTWRSCASSRLDSRSPFFWATLPPSSSFGTAARSSSAGPSRWGCSSPLTPT